MRIEVLKLFSCSTNVSLKLQLFIERKILKIFFLLSPFMPNGISHYCQLEWSISILRVVGRLYVSFLSKF